MTQRDIRDYLQDILNSIDLAQSFVLNMTFDEFQADPKTSFAVIRALEIIGEATKNIPIPIREQYPKIPWKGFTGMRDKLIHAYFGVNLEVVWDTIQQDLPQLRPVIDQILHDNNSQ
jgi:uncharacterized protein with HEPN domain